MSKRKARERAARQRAQLKPDSVSETQARQRERQGLIMTFIRKILRGPVIGFIIFSIIVLQYWLFRKVAIDDQLGSNALTRSDYTFTRSDYTFTRSNYSLTNSNDSVNNEIRSNAPMGSEQIDDSESECSTSPLKVYMYDLPRMYNMGLVNRYDPNQELPWTDPDVTSLYSGNNKQYSVEYWLMVYLLNAQDSQDGEMAAVRVNDPNQADVFFVPFFSALNDYGINMIGKDAEVAKHFEEGLVNKLHKSKWWQASQGRDHVIIAHHRNSFWHYRDILNKSIFILADFKRYKNSVARLEKDIVAPYVHVLSSYKEDNDIDSFSTRKTLLFFRGRIYRKADGLVRAKLWELFVNETDVQYTDRTVPSVRLSVSTEGMRSSRFCLHPAGNTPSSCRLFDAIVNHCVPVIISDRIELPFEDDLDYSEFSLFFSAEDAVKPGHLLGTLRSMERERWTQMWNKLKAVSHHFEYQHPSKKDDAVNMIFKQVQRKVPALKLAMHRSKRLVVRDWYED